MRHGAICNGIMSQRVIVQHCWKCKRRRRFVLSERYDSFLIKCSQGHQYVSGDDGMYYVGKFPNRSSVCAEG